jgi:hypothetical protein
MSNISLCKKCKMGKSSVELWCIIASFHTSRERLSWVISSRFFLSLNDFVSAYGELVKCGALVNTVMSPRVLAPWR